MAASGNGQLIHQRPRRKRSRRGRSIPTLELAGFREAAYRLFSQALLYPEEDRTEGLTDAAQELLRQEDALAHFAFYPELRRLCVAVGGLDRARLNGLQSTYIGLFAARAGGVPCPPYESAFWQPAGQPTGWLLAQVEAAYATAGLAPSRELGELPDHVAIELEFMAVLCGQEATAWAHEDATGAAKVMRRAKRFLDSHLSVWLPTFARRVADADTDGFYRAVSEAAAAFVVYDRDLLAAFLEGLSSEEAPHAADKPPGTRETS